MKKIKYYLDTTIFNFVFAEGDTEKKDITVKLFKDLPSISNGIYISDEVIREINRAPEPRKSQLVGLLEETNPLLLEVDIETEELAERYVKEGIIPERYRSDAVHIAVAVVNGIEVIVSWNFEHIVKLKTRVMVNGINRLLGYHEIEICSPEEVIEL
ncbi:MAG TPA: PIN domain nuclease [Candidatus Wujingus californicus]|uniref:PIN domain nuclease n=1 Tax=Candidatus Wujingus californicus TaxID=3367618 RepID=UPI001DA82A38|nr:PIN domain-containing protein [Planctomycetota bacterium]MDO8130574.1 PIN domain-containing protein [Candidatus Brocadiales bacterium]